MVVGDVGGKEGFSSLDNVLHMAALVQRPRVSVEVTNRKIDVMVVYILTSINTTQYNTIIL